MMAHAALRSQARESALEEPMCISRSA